MSTCNQHSPPTLVTRLYLLLAFSSSLVLAAPFSYTRRDTGSALNLRQTESAASQQQPGGETSGGLSHSTILAAQLSGIAGGYIVTAAIFGTLVFTVGRRLRKAAQASAGVLAVEMMKPTVQEPALAPTKPEPIVTTIAPEPPLSPVSPSRSWFRPFKRGSGTTAVGSVRSPPLSPKSPGVASITSFDQRVVDADRQKRQDEMDRLYAAVMEHDKKNAKVVYQAAPVADSSEEDITPTSPRQNSFRAIYPPPRVPQINTSPPKQRQVGLPASPRSPGLPASPRSTRSGQSFGAPSAAHSRAPSIESVAASARAASSTTNVAASPATIKKNRRTLKNLRISAPMKHYPGGPGSADDEARTPLSPRTYNNLPPPPQPPSATTLPHSPTTPASPPYNAQVIPSSPLGPPENYGNLEQPQSPRGPIPNPNPSRFQAPPSGPASAISANSSTNNLPFRDPAFTALGSPPPTKTTYVQPRRDALHRAAMRTGGLTPATGTVPMTPYSPYMPFTPITPVTPHLVTKQERKIRKKEEGKRLATMDEMVKSPQEIWDDAY